MTRPNAAAQWQVQPGAEALMREVLEDALARSPAAQAFANRLLEACGVRLRDILDHVSVADPALPARLEAQNWRAIAPGLWRHFDGYFPDFLESSETDVIAFRVESAEAFVRAVGVSTPIEGEPHAALRRVAAFSGRDVTFVAIERNGHVGYDAPKTDRALLRQARLHQQIFRTRRRVFDTPEAGFDHTDALVDSAVADLGPHWACDLFFRAEREYWMSRCDAGRLQKARQDAAGIGWANIDHHTYDSTRPLFGRTIRVLEKLGYECRELFYAGHQAGWGSQILEQPVLRSTIFADIDLAPEELDIDFAHLPLAPLAQVRRAGLWCAMHGESMLEAGLNHVAGMYDHAAFRAQMSARGVAMMAPFSNFPHLYQELTEGQWWPVDPARIDALERAGQVSAGEAEDFRLNGAIAAHLENLERNDGFKGFNQPGIDGVLLAIDPRKNMVEA